MRALHFILDALQFCAKLRRFNLLPGLAGSRCAASQCGTSAAFYVLHSLISNTLVYLVAVPSNLILLIVKVDARGCKTLPPALMRRQETAEGGGALGSSTLTLSETVWRALAGRFNRYTLLVMCVQRCYSADDYLRCSCLRPREILPAVCPM